MNILHFRGCSADQALDIPGRVDAGSHFSTPPEEEFDILHVVILVTLRSSKLNEIEVMCRAPCTI